MPLKFKKFQIEDYARIALTDEGAVNGHEQGLGKTLAAYVIAILKVGLLRDAAGTPIRPLCPAEPVLIVAQGDLHDQIIEEGRTHFKTRPLVIRDQQHFLSLSTLTPNGRRTVPPGYYLTSYTALTRNGVTPFPELDRNDPDRMMRLLNLTPALLQEFFDARADRLEPLYEMLGVFPTSTAAEIKGAWFRARKRAAEALLLELDEADRILAAYAPQRRVAPSPGGEAIDEGELDLGAAAN